MIVITPAQKKQIQQCLYNQRKMIKILLDTLRKRDVKILLSVNKLLLKLKNVSIGQNVVLCKTYKTKDGLQTSNLTLFKDCSTIAVYIAGYDPSTKKIICARYIKQKDISLFALPHIQMIRKNHKLDSEKMKVWSQCV